MHTADSVLIYRQLGNRMSSASTSASDASSFSGYARKMAHPKSNMNIHLDNHFKSKIYTSSSPISGNVTITTQRDVRFDSVEIILLGVARTRVDGVSSPHESSHTLLKIPMPIPESSYPVPRVLEAGREYSIPFNFILPNHLTLNACGHRVDSDAVHQSHLSLPPTMGFVQGLWEKDDLAPQMATIEYSVKARIYKDPEMNGRPLKIMEATEPIKVLPAYAEEPPLNITKNDKLYRMTKTKSLRKNIISGKLGRLTASAPQPGAAFIGPDGKVASNTAAQVELKFEPSSPDVAPPKITSMSGKITAHTYYSAGPISSFPNLSDFNSGFSIERRGSYSTSVPVFSSPLDNITWATQVIQERRDSGYATESDARTDSEHSAPERSRRGSKQLHTKQARKSSASASASAPSASASPVFHAATLHVPIHLPAAKRTLLPTFHSCIVSRVYTLTLSLTLSPSAGSTASSSSTTLSLTLPLQIGVDTAGSPAHLRLQQENPAGLPSFEAAVQEAEVDEFLRPRLLSVPDVQFSRDPSALPGYAVHG
ncbi:putative arrestin protein [Phaeoacremonium minimum UCRPA7]|uniref:Putative arrestin protein n=1 Tax=Phaeoacremonium minimum (strain UCR-PA7) TaxID=1286976 RepID=R8BB86_PHAM7|nr:putative arrestin protein [Phaeoacremonium minimum UCRPA7]EON96561.1 putative arrestin protein [Phaeoacremonium minimum UCRPA7]